MNKKALVFMDYNETFDDIGGERYNGFSNVFIGGIRQFCNQFDNEVEIAVITAANYQSPEASIRSDLYCTLLYLPLDIRLHFKYLIEDCSQYMSNIEFNGNDISYTHYQSISHFRGTKKDGVENTLKAIDSNHEITTCVFVGDSETLDLPMIDAKVGNRTKIFILANKRILKSDRYPVYKVDIQKQSQSFSYGKDIIETINPKEKEPLILKTTSKSFGVGKGFQALASYIKEKDREK